MGEPADEAGGAAELVRRYTRAWRLLGEFDDDRLPDAPARPREAAVSYQLEDAQAAVEALRSSLQEQGRGSDYFGKPRGHPLGAILRSLEQTFDARPLYPSAQVRAANLLYLVIKDHPFVDGNKRIGALLFLDYLRQNRLLFQADGQLCLSASTLVALALLIAESEAAGKDAMIRLILGLLEGGE